MRLALPIVLAAAAVGAGACGSDGDEAPARVLPAVRVTVTGPADTATTREETVTVRGTVEPASAEVDVLGRPAEVVGGTFRAKVDLQPGANVIDLAATAPERGPAMTAVRVTREMPIAVPELGGLAPDEAKRRVEDLGLQFEARDAGGLLEELLPGEPAVCGQDPDPGTQVRRGSRVHVVVSKSC